MSRVLALLVIAVGLLAACGDDNGDSAQSGKAYYVYVANQGTTEDISGFILADETGILTEMDRSPFNGLPANSTLVASPGQDALFAADGGVYITYKTIEDGSGMLRPISGAAQSVSNGTASHLAFTPDGARMYASDDINPQMRIFGWDAAAQTLTELGASPVSLPNSQQHVVIEPSGKYMYAPIWGVGDIMSLKINSSGSVASTSGSPFSVGADVQFLAPDPLGKFLFAADGSVQDVYTLAINANNGNLSLKDSAPVGVFINSLSVNADGTYLYATTGSGVYIFSVNRTSGALSQVSGSPFFGSLSVNHVAASPDGKFLLVPDSSFDLIWVAAIGGTGKPTKISGSAADTGDGPSFVLVIDPEATTP